MSDGAAGIVKASFETKNAPLQVVYETLEKYGN
jgi:hypothetical protein